MKKLKEFKNRVIKKIAQKYANFLIDRLEQSADQQEFEMWFTQALYLDLYCEQREIYLD